MESTIKSKALTKFFEAAETIVNPELEKWIEQGGKVAGLFCSYSPEEIITAAGMVPMRARATGSTGTELSDQYLSNVNCSFTRHTFNMGLKGDYDFLESAIWVSSCDHVRRIYDNWKRKVDTPLPHMMSLPKKTSDAQAEWWKGELTILKETLEGHFVMAITDDMLHEAIKVHNETRRLLRRLYEFRKKDNPPITGAEAMAVVVASQSMPRVRFNELMNELLEDLEEAEGINGYRARLMIIGGILDDPAYIKVIEEQGGLVVTDSLCFGTRTFASDIDEKGDPLAAIAKWYIQEKPACPRMFDTQRSRVGFVRDMINEFKVDGIIGERLLFCDQWCVEHYQLEKEFKPEGVHYMSLDREYITAGVGQLRTRAQAFMETIGR